MDLKLVQRIRAAAQPDRFTILMEGLFGEGAEDRGGLVNQMNLALHNLQGYRISAQPGYYLAIVPPDETKKHTRKVIVTADEFGQVIKKEQEQDVRAYDFLRDYLGLGGEEPFSPQKMARKYPSCVPEDVDANEDWCDAIARVIIKGATRQINGPGKKRF